MVNAKLHIICGNCGSNDFFEYELTEDVVNEADDNEYIQGKVYIICDNCSTVHDLNDNATNRKGTLTDEQVVSKNILCSCCDNNKERIFPNCSNLSESLTFEDGYCLCPYYHVKTEDIVTEKSVSNYSAYHKVLQGVVATGSTEAEAILNLIKAILLHTRP